MSRNRLHHCYAFLGLMLLTSAGAGCQHLDLIDKDSPRRLPKASANNPVKEIICLWEPAEGTGLDGQPCRGLAGQVLFFSTRYREPVLVNGTVEITVFDDQGPSADSPEQIDTFTFSPDEWALFMRQSKSLGAAYQLFVPYSRKGNHQAVCTVRVKYTPPEPTGIPIFSRSASISLVGPKPRTGKAGQSASSSSSTNSSATTPPHNVRAEVAARGELADLRKIAQAVGQEQAPPTTVSQAGGIDPNSPLAAERDRLKRRMSEILEDDLDTLKHQPWKPEQRTIRPEPITPSPAHPLN